MISGFAWFSLVSSLALTGRFGFAGGFAFVDRFGFANGFAFVDWFGLTNGFALSGRSGLALTDLFGCFNILSIVCVLDLADMFGLRAISITITIIVRPYFRGCQIAATKLIRRCAC